MWMAQLRRWSRLVLLLRPAARAGAGYGAATARVHGVGGCAGPAQEVLERHLGPQAAAGALDVPPHLVHRLPARRGGRAGRAKEIVQVHAVQLAVHLAEGEAADRALPRQGPAAAGRAAVG
uniref:Uncharacterized protein n=1 Tax=Arundo donax TaxID=35708 RepID=A0A0A9MKW7_ARUDO